MKTGAGDVSVKWSLGYWSRISFLSLTRIPRKVSKISRLLFGVCGAQREFRVRTPFASLSLFIAVR